MAKEKKQPLRILVVDDLPENLYLLQHMLDASGYETETAANGTEALEKLRGGRFDAVISDIMMPLMDGFEFCHNVKTDSRLRHLPFIFYTATYTDDQDEAFALSLGANAFITKPTEPEEFIRLLRKVLREAAGVPPRQIAPRLTESQMSFLREYNLRLVHKLEQKVHEAWEANEKLHQLNLTLERHVQNKTAQLLESNRELESFADSVAHDLRAPLRAIQSFATILLEDHGGEFSSTAADYLHRIRDSGRRMERLIKDLLTYSHTLRSDLPLQRVELEPLVREIVEANPAFQQPQAEVQVQSPLLPVTGNPIALNQCVANLVSNAVKFVPPGRTPQVRLRTEPHNGTVRLWVEDNGIGIPENQLWRMFRPFERLQSARQFEGTGLGLVIVRKAVERMGGEVGIESEPGKGSRFWIQLPQAKE